MTITVLCERSLRVENDDDDDEEEKEKEKERKVANKRR